MSAVTRTSRVRSLTARELPLTFEGYLVYCRDDTLEQFQEVGVENGGVGKDRRACEPSENCSIFGSGSNGGIDGNAWGVYATCARVMGYAGLDWGNIRGIHGQRA